MSAIVRVTGQVRKIDPRTKKSSGEVFGREVTVSTEIGDFLGDSIAVMVFNPRGHEVDPIAGLQPRDEVDWIVEVESSNFGLRGRYKGEASALSALPPVGASAAVGF